MRTDPITDPLCMRLVTFGDRHPTLLGFQILVQPSVVRTLEVLASGYTGDEIRHPETNLFCTMACVSCPDIEMAQTQMVFYLRGTAYDRDFECVVREFRYHDMPTITWMVKKAVRRFNLAYSRRNDDSEIIFPDEAALKVIASQYHADGWRGLVVRHEEYIQ